MEILRADDSCELTVVTYDWDFAQGDQGFMPAVCETGGMPVWEYGVEANPEVPLDVACWGTILNADYVNDSGDGLLAPLFTVTDSAYLMEVSHWLDIETNYDGCNVSVNGTVIEPYTVYPATLSTSTNYYAFCVDMEQGWTGHDIMQSLDCFDLSAFMGEEVQVSFDFGSDSSVTYPGQYLLYVKVGAAGSTPTEGTTWGAIKGLFQ